jgi:DNA-binding SARP family transcriptional activator
VEIAILGSVDVRVDGVSARVRRRHQRLLIAALALDANAIVSIDRITALLWEGEPPEHGRAQIHVHVSTLRRLLAGNTNTATAIETHPEGYRLRVPPASVDLVRFEHLVAQAQTAAEAGRLAEAGRAYQDGLGLWRGPALDGLTGRFAESEAARLNERRIAVLK